MVCSLAVLESGVMFETRFQTYWADVDAAGIVHLPHFFEFISQAEEELFRSAGADRDRLIQQHGVWMARVEAYAKFSKPIRQGLTIRVHMTPRLHGLKTIRYDFVILNDQSAEHLATGYITTVCVDAVSFKSIPIPEPIRTIVEQLQQ